MYDLLFSYDNKKGFKDQDLTNFYFALQKLSQELKESVDLQLKFNKQNRELGLKKIELMKVKRDLKKEKEMVGYLKLENGYYKQNREVQKELIGEQRKQIVKGKNKLEGEEKKYEQMNRRMEFVLENDICRRLGAGGNGNNVKGENQRLR